MSRMLTAADPAPLVPEVALDWWRAQDPPWAQPIGAAPVDRVRTAGLAGLVTGNETADRVRAKGSTPLQLAGKRTTRVLTSPSFGTYKVPLPDVVWTNAATNPDAQWFGVDTVKAHYWEVSSLRVGLLGWWAHGVRRHDLAGRWDAQRGVAGGGIPIWALIPTPSELSGGTFDRALNFVVAGSYSRERVPWIAKGDGTLVSHPLRAGERLRLTSGARERLWGTAVTPDDLGLLKILSTFGAVVNDKTSATAGHNLRLPAGAAVTVRLTITDFEVVAT